MRDSALPHPHLACVAAQAAWFLLSPAPQQLVANPVVPDGVQEWWEAAVGRGIPGTSPRMSCLQVDCSGVRQNLSSVGRMPGIALGNSGPLG